MMAMKIWRYHTLRLLGWTSLKILILATPNPKVPLLGEEERTKTLAYDNWSESWRDVEWNDSGGGGKRKAGMHMGAYCARLNSEGAHVGVCFLHLTTKLGFKGGSRSERIRLSTSIRK